MTPHESSDLLERIHDDFPDYRAFAGDEEGDQWYVVIETPPPSGFIVLTSVSQYEQWKQRENGAGTRRREWRISDEVAD